MANHQKSTGPVDSRRRSFLLTVGTGGAAAVATAIKPASAAVAEVPAATPAPESQGYRDTEHVRVYYRTTRI
jgi:hypothetical protein